MASLEDYDEFGNYIGADLDSDEEGVEVQQDVYPPSAPAQAAPLEGFEDEPVPANEESALMEIDGPSCFSSAIT